MKNGDINNAKGKPKRSLSSMSRRTFLKLSALTGGAVVIGRLISRPVLGAGASPPESEEGVIGEKWIPTSCLNCSTRCATRVRVVNGKAVRIAGNSLSQVSEWMGPAYQYYEYDRIFHAPSRKFEFRSGNLEALLKRTGQEIDRLT